MKFHYTAFIGLAFFFTGTAAAAQEDMQAQIKIILETLAAQEMVIQNHLEKISALERKNADLENKIATAKNTANTAVSKADGAQDTANKANKKYCYITGSGFAQDFLECPYGGTYKGAIDFYNTKIAITGINQQQRWIDSRHFWLCCL